MNRADTQAEYLAWRKRFILRLTLFHFALVLVFDFLSIYAPQIITRAISSDSAFTIGLLFALGIVMSVIFSTFYYSWRVSEKEAAIKKLPV